MKKILIPGMIAAALLITSATKAQVSVSINIGAQPQWGPVGYDYAQFYYMPDIDVFYNIQQREYVYMNGGRWMNSPYLPDRCRNYDLYGGYKVVINEPAPWKRWNFYHDRYVNYRSYPRQVVIRDSRDPRYRVGPGYGGRRDNDRYDRRDNDRYDRRPDYRQDNRDHDRGRGYDDNGRGHGNGNGNGHGRRF
ncbi:MAG: hypothetical protein QM731_10260 [Chitinophagaceae bacterium]